MTNLGTRVFKRNKIKDLFFFLLFTTFTTIGFSIHKESNVKSLIGIVFFGTGSFLFLIQLIANFNYLKLNNEGFEQRSLLTTKGFKWKDVSNFEVRNFRWNESIYFDHKDEFGNHNWKSITSSYTIKTKDLIKLMRKYKDNSKNMLHDRV